MEFYNSNTLGIHEIDAQRDFQFISNMNMNRSPPSPHPSPPFHSFPNSPFNSPTHDPLVAPIWYSRSFDRFGSPIIDSSAKFHQILLQNHRGSVSPSCSSPSSSSSSRGSLSPLTSIENLQTPPSRSPPVKYATPVKVEEDVLVMDGILVKSSPGSGGGGGNGNRSKSVLDSGLSPLRSRYSSNKSELCHAWEMTKTCPYGSKCQFAHGKEDVRPNRQNSTKNKSDAVACKTFNTTGSCTYGTQCRFGHYETGAVARRIIPKVLVAKEQEKGKAVSSPARASSIDQDFQNVVWSPMDDNIPVYKMPSSTAEPRLLDDKEQLEAHMKSILHGPPLLKRRLPVFSDIYSAD